jgi:glycosyltransferase involved in cell wall biosynthesis
VLPVSKILKESLQNYYGIKTKIAVVPNTVDVKRFAVSSKLSTPRKIQILTVCSLVPIKGVNYLLEALNKIKQKRQDFFLHIVGDGPLRNEYELLNMKLGLNSIVKFHGRQSNVEEFMRNCDFFVLPSFYETFGVVYIEAMSCGKPVIATNRGGPSEIVTKDVGILVPPKNVEVLQEAIEYMMNNYQAYSSEKIALYAQENFSHEAVGMILNKIYREALFEHKGE